jgi:predicted outer membrane protein
MKIRMFYTISLVIVGLVSPMLAQTPEAAESPSVPTPPISPPASTENPAAPMSTAAIEPEQKLTLEQKVLSKMHMVNQLEIRVGEMASEKGESANTRSYGNRLFRNHQFGDRKVIDLANRLRIELVEARAFGTEKSASLASRRQLSCCAPQT